jgi:hypothetical protein
LTRIREIGRAPVESQIETAATAFPEMTRAARSF